MTLLIWYLAGSSVATLWVFAALGVAGAAGHYLEEVYP